MGLSYYSLKVLMKLFSHVSLLELLQKDVKNLLPISLRWEYVGANSF